MNRSVRIRKGIAAFIGGCAVASIALASSDTATLTVGHFTLVAGIIDTCESGYGSGGPVGSYSPTGLTGGEIVQTILDADIVSADSCTDVEVITHTSSLIVSGFSIDPGQTWVTSITCNGVEKTGASASSFSYSSGTATWHWPSDFSLISKPSGTNVSCTISHS